MNDHHSMTGGRLLVDCLIEQGCDRIFTVPGESFLAVLDALQCLGAQCHRHVDVNEPQGQLAEVLGEAVRNP